MKPSSIAALLAILTLLWGAATQWQSLKDRVQALEDHEIYLHGKITIPK